MSPEEQSSVEERQGARYLLTGVVSRYANAPDLNRDELVDDLERVTNLFCGDFGYTHVPYLGMDPTALQLKNSLRKFCKSSSRDDYLIVYLAGHGEVLSRGSFRSEHFFLPSDLQPDDMYGSAIRLAEIGDWILADTEVRRLIFILDTCMSGHGVVDMARDALDWSTTVTRMGSGAGAALLWSAQPKEFAFPGQFTKALVAAARGRPSGGHAQGSRALDSIMNVLAIDYPAGQKQTAGKVDLFGTPSEIDFFPNQSLDPSLIELSLEEQDRRWQARLRQEYARRDDMRGKFYTTTADFVGRHEALTVIATWLNNAHDMRSLIVTGDPGSGKTAVLGMIAAMSDPRRLPGALRVNTPKRAIPRADTIDVAIYAGRLTAGQVLSAIAAGLELDLVGDPAENPGAAVTSILVAAARLATERNRPYTAIIDALDECTSPSQVSDQVVRPIQIRGTGSIRLLLGARRNIRDWYLGRDWAQRYVNVDLDDAVFTDAEGMRSAIVRTLVDHRAIGADIDAPVSDDRLQFGRVTDVADAIVEAAGHSYYVASIIARMQARRPTLPGPSDQEWLSELPRDAGHAMAQDLEQHFSGNLSMAIDLLLPLAYARGEGLPWEEVWVGLARALSRGPSYSNVDIVDLVRGAGSYVVETGLLEARSIYRLYHQSLVDYLLAGRDSIRDETDICRALVARIPRRNDSRLDWANAHPYTRAFLSSHAYAAGLLDEFLEEPGFLVTAEPSVLVDLITRASAIPAEQNVQRASGRATAISEAYRCAAPAMRSHQLSERAAYLAFEARRSGADTFADRILDEVQAVSWRPRWVKWRREQKESTFAGHVGRITCVAVTRISGTPVIVSSGADGTVRVWDMTTGAPRGAPLIGHTDRVFSVALANVSDRQFIISGSSDRTVRVWDLETGAPVGLPIVGHTDEVNSVAVCELGTRLVVVSAADDATVRVWDLMTGEQIGEAFRGHEGHVYEVAIADLNGRQVVVSGGADATVRIWDLLTGAPIGSPLVGHTDEVNSVAVEEIDGRAVVVSGSDDRTLRRWDLLTQTPLGGPMRGHADRVFSVAFAHTDRTLLVSGGGDRTVRIWDAATGLPLGAPMSGHFDEINSIATSQLYGHPVAVSAGFDARICLWNLATGTSLAEPTVRSSARIPQGQASRRAAHADRVTALATGERSGRPIVVSSGADRTVRVWDLETGDPVGAPFNGHTDTVTGLAIGQLATRPIVVSSSADRTVRVWDLETGDPVGAPFNGHTDTVTGLAIGQLATRPIVVSSSADRTVRLWDLETGAKLHQPLRGHASRVCSVAVADVDGRKIAISAGGDMTLRLWDIAEGKSCGDPLRGHNGCIWTVSVGQLFGRSAFISAGDDAVRVWEFRDRSHGRALNATHQLAIQFPAPGHSAVVLENGMVVGTNEGMVAIEVLRW